jgi:hypothetical protein
MGENIRVKDQERRFYPGLRHDIFIQIPAIDARRDAPIQIIHEDQIEKAVLVLF